MSLARNHRIDLRWAAIACLVATAAIHITLIPAHLREAPYAGLLFIGLSASALVTAAVLATCENRLAWACAALLSGGALLAYVASRSIGLPSLGDDVGDWLNPLGVCAVACEAATLLLSVHLLSPRTPLRLGA